MNHFKENARFSSLIDESSNKKVFGKKTENKKKIIEKESEKLPEKESEKLPEKITQKETNNIFKSNSIFNNDRDGDRNRSRNLYGRERDKEFIEMLQKQEEMNKIKEEKLKEEEKMKSLSLDNFPELVSKKNNANPVIVENTTDFLEKLKTSKVEQKTEKIPIGWSILTKNYKTNETNILTNIKSVEPIYTKTQEDLDYEVIDHLVYLHEKRTAEYIENWGQDEWEKMFLFPNYDYYYFDKLDEEYNENIDLSDDTDNDYEYYDYEEEEYWKKY